MDRPVHRKSDAIAGRSSGLRVVASARLPGFFDPVTSGQSLSAHSYGHSRRLAPSLALGGGTAFPLSFRLRKTDDAHSIRTPGLCVKTVAAGAAATRCESRSARRAWRDHAQQSQCFRISGAHKNLGAAPAETEAPDASRPRPCVQQRLSRFAGGAKLRNLLQAAWAEAGRGLWLLSFGRRRRGSSAIAPHRHHRRQLHAPAAAFGLALEGRAATRTGDVHRPRLLMPPPLPRSIAASRRRLARAPALREPPGAGRESALPGRCRS